MPARAVKPELANAAAPVSPSGNSALIRRTPLASNRYSSSAIRALPSESSRVTRASDSSSDLVCTVPVGLCGLQSRTTHRPTAVCTRAIVSPMRSMSRRPARVSGATPMFRSACETYEKKGA